MVIAIINEIEQLLQNFGQLKKIAAGLKFD